MVFMLLSALFVIPLTTEPVFGFENHFEFKRGVVRDHVSDDDIRTVLLRSSTWELTYPVYELGSGNQLELVFDDLSVGIRSFDYTLLHCDAGWRPSELEPQEYLSGMGQGTLQSPGHSVNTTQDFFHFSLVFPVEECMPVLGGNYVILIYESGDPDNPVITRRFSVNENLVKTEGVVRQAPAGEFRETGQQVQFSVSYGNMDIRDPLRDLVVVIRQNGRDDNSLAGLKPSFVSPGRIEYNGMDQGIFPGGNEFRSLDIKSMKYQTENVAGIEFQNPYYHVFLKPEKERESRPYFYKADLNGRFFIDREKAIDKQAEADYVFVHFCLEQPYPREEEVYVTGGMADWAPSDRYRMQFNPAKSCYEAVVQLKQGLYDYAYAALSKPDGKLHTDIFEGNYFETKNDYEIFVYLHDSRSRCDRLVGYLPIRTIP